MAIEEQIMKLQTYKMYEGEDTVYVERDDVLKALEQTELTPSYNSVKTELKPCEDILEKIRTEIEALSNSNPSYTHTCDVVDREDVLDIIDKYKAESEDKE